MLEVLKTAIPEFFNGQAWLVKDPGTGQHFAVSGTVAPFTGWEVLVFPCNSEGEPESWGEVAGGRGVSHEDAIRDLDDAIKRGDLYPCKKHKFWRCWECGEEKRTETYGENYSYLRGAAPFQSVASHDPRISPKRPY